MLFRGRSIYCLSNSGTSDRSASALRRRPRFHSSIPLRAFLRYDVQHLAQTSRELIRDLIYETYDRSRYSGGKPENRRPSSEEKLESLYGHWRPSRAKIGQTTLDQRLTWSKVGREDTLSFEQHHFVDRSHQPKGRSITKNLWEKAHPTGYRYTCYFASQ